ncbi:MAG: PD-(D/E)XK nuclease family protein [Erysipelotrichaceae bacterium]|nr:PD-(D/E)XK nuclease family protein [Erysipelotrichaceae bacterium]
MLCPSTYKNQVLKSLSAEKKITDIKFMDLNEYRKNLCFDYGIHAIKYLTDRYGLSVENAREIMNNLYYVEDKDYGNEKLNRLVEYRNELDRQGLLIYNRLFTKYLSDKKLIVAGYGELNRSDRSIIEGEVVPFEETDRIYTVNVFESIEEEVEYLYNAIFDLLKKGVDINDIYILGATADYESYFKRYNTYYGFKIDVESNDKLVGASLAGEFLERIDSSDKGEIYEWLISHDSPIVKKIVNIINRYAEFDLKEVKEFILNDLKKTNVSDGNYRNVVKCADMFTPFEESDHVFLIGFNDQIPALKNDTEYITNNLRSLLNMSGIEEENELIKKNTRGYLSGIKNLYLSYSERSPFRKYNPSNLFSKEKIKETKQGKQDYSHSEGVNRLKYAYMQDRCQKYGTRDDDYSLMYKNYGRNGYGSYSNKFNGLSDEQIRNIGSVRLSYTHINTFYQCCFMYYLDRILKLSDGSDNFNTRIGGICHEVLQDMYTGRDFDFDDAWQKAYEGEERKVEEGEKLFADEAEEFFVEKIREELKQDLEIIKAQKESTLLDKELCEQGFNVEVEDGILFTGKIDKVMYREDDDSVVANVVDYKTGSSSDIDKSLMEYGLSLQLPSYMYLLSRQNPFNDKEIHFGGLYLQHLINNSNKYDVKKTLAEQKAESMKLDGFSTDSLDRLEVTDPDLSEGQSSSLYRKITMNKTGNLSANSRTMSDAEMKEKIELVDKKIREAGHEILKGDFRINPKQINGDNVSCKYCPYGDICFKRNVDLDIINKGSREDSDEVD